jgi:hypothetical protein
MISSMDAGVRSNSVFVSSGCCLEGSTLVNTSIGLLPIGKIVNEQMHIQVFTYNELTRNIDLNFIQEWHSNGSLFIAHWRIFTFITIIHLLILRSLFNMKSSLIKVQD